MNTVPTSLNRHPVGHGGGDELGPVVEAHEGGSTALQGEALKGGHDAVGVDGAPHDDGRALAGCTRRRR
jgi:hypothetical protein